MNPQPLDLESSALPIELHPYSVANSGQVCSQRTPVPSGRISLKSTLVSLRNRCQPALFLPRFLVDRVTPKLRTVLLQLQPFCTTSLFLHAVIPHACFGAFKPDVLSHPKSRFQKLPGSKLAPLTQFDARRLLNNFRNDARAHCSAAFTNCETAAIHHGDRLAELNLQSNIVARHTHLSTAK